MARSARKVAQGAGEMASAYGARNQAQQAKPKTKKKSTPAPSPVVTYTWGGVPVTHSGFGTFMGGTPAQKQAIGALSAAAQPSPTPQSTINPLFEGVYNQSVGNALTTRNNSILGIDRGDAATAYDYGFNFTPGSYDANGFYNNNYDISGNYTQALGADGQPLNPFSKMALLQRAYEQTKAGTANSYASQGQLHSGAYGSMVNENAFNNNANIHDLMRAFQQIMIGSTNDAAAAGDAYNTGVGTAAWQRLQNYLTGGTSG